MAFHLINYLLKWINLNNINKLNDNPWIVQPFEKYEEIRIEDLKKNHK